MDIQGPGADLLTIRRDTGGDYRIFTTSATVALSGLTMANGLVHGDGDGGGIYNTGTLTMSNCSLSGNKSDLPAFIASDHGGGGGIFNAGTLTLRDCYLSGNSTTYGILGHGFGGGIFNEGVLSVSNSTITGNSSAAGGGGIYNYGANQGILSISNSTISGNSAQFGGGIHNFGETATIINCTLQANVAITGGGGILSETGALIIIGSTVSGNISTFEIGGGIYNRGTLTVTGSTFSGNTGAGILCASNSIDSSVSDSTVSGNTFSGIEITGELTVTNCTISGNIVDIYYGSGISNTGTLNLTSSTVSGNSGSYGSGIFNEGTFTARNSIIALNSNGDILNSVDGIADISNHNFIGDRDGDPKLGPLADNGGPTQTMALLPGSPCVNAGDPNFTGLDFDQRGPGFARVVSGRVDIGAYELRVPLSGLLQDLTARLAASVQDGTLNSGQGTALANPLKNAAIQLAAGQPKQAVQSLTTFVNQVNARIKALNPKDTDYATKLAELQTLLTEAQSIVTPLLGP